MIALISRSYSKPIRLYKNGVSMFPSGMMLLFQSAYWTEPTKTRSSPPIAAIRRSYVDSTASPFPSPTYSRHMATDSVEDDVQQLMKVQKRI